MPWIIIIPVLVALLVGWLWLADVNGVLDEHPRIKKLTQSPRLKWTAGALALGGLGLWLVTKSGGKARARREHANRIVDQLRDRERTRIAARAETAEADEGLARLDAETSAAMVAIDEKQAATVATILAERQRAGGMTLEESGAVLNALLHRIKDRPSP